MASTKPWVAVSDANPPAGMVWLFKEYSNAYTPLARQRAGVHPDGGTGSLLVKLNDPGCPLLVVPQAGGKVVLLTPGACGAVRSTWKWQPWAYAEV